MNKLLFVFLLLGYSALVGAQTLDDYLKEAAENNPGLLAKYKVFEAAMQQTAKVGSLPDPNLAFGYFISPVETRVGPQQAKFSLTQMFPWFGTLRAQEEAATFMAEAKYQEFLDARNKLYYQVSAAYFPLYELQKLIEIEEANLQILTGYKDVTSVKYENDQGSLVDLLRIDIMEKDAKTNLSILRKKRAPMESQFNALLNRPDSLKVPVDTTYQISSIDDNFLKDSLTVGNPVLDQLSLKIKASEAQEKAAKRQGMPNLGIGLDYVIVGERTDMNVPDNGQDAIMPMLSVSLPIYRKKYKAARQEAQLMQEAYTLQHQDMSNRLISSYEMIRFEMIKQVELNRLYQQQAIESRQSLNLLYTSYGNSGKDFEEVLRMQQQVLKYERLSVNAIRAFLIARAELDYVTAKQN